MVVSVLRERKNERKGEWERMREKEEERERRIEEDKHNEDWSIMKIETDTVFSEK